MTQCEQGLLAEPSVVSPNEARWVVCRRAELLNGPMDELLHRVYADVPAGLHPVARRSLLAHLLKLQGDGLATADGERWGFSG